MPETNYSAYIYQDQRGFERSPADFKAKGILPHPGNVIDCTVLDISENGARIELRDIDIVPHRFKLFIPQTHTLCECRVARQSGREIGVQFESKIDLKSDPPTSKSQ